MEVDCLNLVQAIRSNIRMISTVYLVNADIKFVKCSAIWWAVAYMLALASCSLPDRCSTGSDIPYNVMDLFIREQFV